MTPPSRPPKTQSRQDLGQVGEQLVALWLQQQGWQILHHRWHSRWGEIDLIAQSLTSELAFVEVKTRSRGNWDADGRLAITVQKQRKFSQTAALFLSQYPSWADFPCRFDCALVQSRPVSGLADQIPPQIELGQSIILGGFELILQDYILGAFEWVE